MSKVRIGILGAGYWGPNLIRVFDQLPTSSVVAIADLDEKKLAKFKSVYKDANLTTDPDALLADPEVDAVVVSLPASLHYKWALKALEAGKHCFVEKPLATTSADCRHLIEEAEKRGLRLMVGHTFEYNTAVSKIRDYIRDGDLGQIFNIFSQRLNLGQVRSDVDALWNLAPHDISIALYWMGGHLPKWVSAQGFAFLQPGVSDIGNITMEFESGAVAQILVSWLSPDKIRKIMITGSRRMIIYDDVSSDAKIQIFDKGVDFINKDGESWSSHSGFGEFQLRLRSGDLLIPRVDSIEPLRTEASHFVDCIKNGKTPDTDGHNGLRVVQILEAADESRRQGGARIVIGPAS